MEFKTVELTDEQIRIAIRMLTEKREEMQVILKNPEGLESDTIVFIERDLVKINDVIRELQFYALTADKSDKPSELHRY